MCVTSVSESKNFTPFQSTNRFRVIGGFWDKRTEWPTNDLKDYNTYKVKGTQYPTNPKFQSFLLYQQPFFFFVLFCFFFWVLQAILRQVHWMTPKGTWISRGQICPIHVLPVPPNPKFQLVLLYRYFEKSARNDQQMIFNPTSSNVPHMCYQYPWSPNFTPFRSTINGFWDIAHLRQVHHMTSK